MKILIWPYCGKDKHLETFCVSVRGVMPPAFTLDKQQLKHHEPQNYSTADIIDRIREHNRLIDGLLMRYILSLFFDEMKEILEAGHRVHIQ